MQKYCTKCNNPTNYTDSLPLYCSICGQPFAATVASQIKIEPIRVQKTPIKNKEEIWDEIEEETTLSFNIPIIEIEEIPKVQKQKLESIAFDKGHKEIINRPKMKKMSKREFEENFKEEILNKPSREISVGFNNRE